MSFSSKSTKLPKSKNKKEIPWILEGIVNYLRSPVWIVPIMNFVDENCSCFENKEENKLEYTEIHQQYKELVEKLITAYVKELGITEAQFSAACNESSTGFDKLEGMFQYIWAADDFLLFKRLMSKHNLELEMQAISLSQEKSDAHDWGDFPPYNPAFVSAQAHCNSGQEKSSLVATEDRKGPELQEIMSQSRQDYLDFLQEKTVLHQREEEDLLRALHFSKQEMKRLNAQALEEKRMLEEAIRLSLEDCRKTITVDSAASPPATDKVDANIVPDMPSSSSSLKNAVHSRSPPTSSLNSSSQKKEKRPKSKTSTEVQSLPPIQQKVALSNEEAALDWIAHAKKETGSAEEQGIKKMNSVKNQHLLLAKKSGIDPAELAQRKAYLLSQRQKLLEAKKQQRNEELLQYQSDVASENLSGKEHPSQDLSYSQGEDEALSARRALAERLKKEVISKTH